MNFFYNKYFALGVLASFGLVGLADGASRGKVTILDANSPGLLALQSYASDCDSSDSDSEEGIEGAVSVLGGSFAGVVTSPVRAGAIPLVQQPSPGAALKISPLVAKITPDQRRLKINSSTLRQTARSLSGVNQFIKIPFEVKCSLVAEKLQYSEGLTLLLAQLQTIERASLHNLERAFWDERLIKFHDRVVTMQPYRTVARTVAARAASPKNASIPVSIPEMSTSTNANNIIDHACSYELLLKALVHVDTQVYEVAKNVVLNDGASISTSVIELVYPVSCEYVEKAGSYQYQKYCVISFGRPPLAELHEAAFLDRFWHVFHACLQDRAHTHGRTPVNVCLEIVEENGTERLELVKK